MSIIYLHINNQQHWSRFVLLRSVAKLAFDVGIGVIRYALFLFLFHIQQTSIVMTKLIMNGDKLLKLLDESSVVSCRRKNYRNL